MSGSEVSVLACFILLSEAIKIRMAQNGQRMDRVDDKVKQILTHGALRLNSETRPKSRHCCHCMPT